MPRFLFRPKWIAFHALVISAVAVMVAAGFWQLSRLDERRTFNADVTARSEQPAIPLGSLVDEDGFTPTGAEWRVVTASGVYLPDQILVFNRSQNGRAGDNVLAPLALDDGRTVLVNRGFITLGNSAPPIPGTGVQIIGRVRPSQERNRGGLTDESEGPITEIRRVDIAKLTPQLPGEVLPVYIDLIASTPEVNPTDPEPVPAPVLDEGNHLSYAFQWFIFSVCVLVGWVLAMRRSIKTAAQGAQKLLDSQQPIDAESTTTPI